MIVWIIIGVAGVLDAISLLFAFSAQWNVRTAGRILKGLPEGDPPWYVRASDRIDKLIPGGKS